MSNSRKFYKSDPSRLDYVYDLSDWLGTGDTVSSYSLTATGVTLDGDTNDTDSITVWVEGNEGTVVAAVVSTTGREEEFTMTFVESC